MREDLKKSMVFVGVTIVASYAVAGAAWLAGVRLGSPAGMSLMIGYMFIPMTVAMILQKLVYGARLRDLGISWRPNRWFLFGPLLPPAIVLGSIFLSIVLFHAHRRPTPVHPLLLLITGLVAGSTVNAVAGFGEEYGWRGFLQGHLAFVGFWRSSLVIGVVWGLWHAPLVLQGYNYPQHPVTGVMMMTCWTTLFAPLIGFVRLRSKSVLAAAIMHGSVNGTFGIALATLKGGSDLTTGALGVAGLLVLAMANLTLLISWRRLDGESAIAVQSVSSPAFARAS